MDAGDDPMNWPAMDSAARLRQLRTEHHDFVGAAGSKMGGLVIELHAAHDALRAIAALLDRANDRGEGGVLDGISTVVAAALAPLPAQPDFALPAENRRWLAETVGPALLDTDWDVAGALGVTRAEAAVMFVCGHYLGHLMHQGLVASLGPLALAAHYFSTYCLHDLHGECRLRCKTCLAHCRCACHQPSGSPG